MKPNKERPTKALQNRHLIWKEPRPAILTAIDLKGFTRWTDAEVEAAIEEDE